MRFARGFFVCAALALSGTASAVPVFTDNFASATEGSNLGGRAPQVGNAWAVPVPTTGVPVHTTTATGDTALPYVETQGAERQIRASWNAPLSAGQTITVSVPLRPSSGNFWAGNAGFALQDATGNTTAAFFGSSADGTLGDQAHGFQIANTEAGGAQILSTSNSDQTQTLKVTYVYDTGLTTLTVGNNVASVSGTYASQVPVSQIYLHNNGGADFRFQGLTVDVTPEPASAGLLSVGAIGLLVRRRKQGPARS